MNDIVSLSLLKENGLKLNCNLVLLNTYQFKVALKFLEEKECISWMSYCIMYMKYCHSQILCKNQFTRTYVLSFFCFSWKYKNNFHYFLAIK